MIVPEASHELAAPDPLPRAPAWLLWATGLVAVVGGILAITVAVLVVISVLGRWLADRPIEGDFELVKMATALAVFTFLPFTQARGGNVVVDTFTTKLSPRARRAIDAFWDLVYAGMMTVFAVGLAIGTSEARASGEASMQLQLAVWPVIGACSLLCALLVTTALVTASSFRRRQH